MIFTKRLKRFFLYICLVMASCSFLTTKNAKSTQDEHISIFLASDNNYAPYVATTMASILKHTNSYVDFYVLSDRISDINKQKIKNTNKYFSDKKFTIKFVEMKEDMYKSLSTDSRITRAMYNRYMSCDINKDIKKALYLDIDMIITNDIKELYDQDLGDYTIGAVPENKRFIKRYVTRINKHIAKISKDHKYFNSGMLLFNCEKYRHDDVKDKLFELGRKYSQNKYLSLQDQDILNIYFDSNYKILDRKFNNMTAEYSGYSKEMKYSSAEEQNFIKNSVVFHYVGTDKPWKKKDELFANEFWQIVPYTDFENEINSAFTYYNMKSKLRKESIYKRNNRHIIILYALVAFGIILGVIAIVVASRRNNRSKI